MNNKATYLTPFQYLGEFILLGWDTFRFIVSGKINVRHTLLQMSLIGVNSLPIVALTITFTGMVIALQTTRELNRFGAGQFVGGMVAVAMARELAPMLVGVVVAGFAGSSIAAEIGTMKVTEQIDALRVMATHPVKYLVVPRLLAAMCMLPMLTVFANFSGCGGGYFIAVHFGGVNPVDYIRSATTFLKISEFLFGLLKAGVFGALIVLVSCHQGLTTEGGAFGVGRATVLSVVLSIVFIFISNYFLSWLMFGNLK